MAAIAFVKEGWGLPVLALCLKNKAGAAIDCFLFGKKAGGCQRLLFCCLRKAGGAIAVLFLKIRPGAASDCFVLKREGWGLPLLAVLKAGGCHWLLFVVQKKVGGCPCLFFV